MAQVTVREATQAEALAGVLGSPVYISPRRLAQAAGGIIIYHGTNATTYSDLGAAKAGAVAGDTINVIGGIYNTNNLLKNGVNWNFENTYIWYYAVTNNSTGALGIFDDRGSGACTSSIYGSLNFFYSTGTNNYVFDVGATNSLGAWVVTNGNSSINFDFDTGDGESYLASVTEFVPALLQVGLGFTNSGTTNWTHFKQIINTHRDNTVAGQGNSMSGCVWGMGDFFLHGDYVGIFGNGVYGIWCNQVPATNTANGNFTVDLCEGYLYQSANNLNYKSWVDFKEYRGSANNPQGISVLGGKMYLKASKLYGKVDYFFNLGSGTELWVNAQKITNDGGKGFLNNANSSTWLTIANYEDLQAVTAPRFLVSQGKVVINGGDAVGMGSGIGFNVTGGYLETHDLSQTNFGTNYLISGGIVRSEGGWNTTIGTAGKGIVMSGGVAEFRNTTFDTSSVNNTANNPVLVNSDNLTLKAVTLVAGAAATSMQAVTTNNITVFWPSQNTSNLNVKVIGPTAPSFLAPAIAIASTSNWTNTLGVVCIAYVTATTFALKNVNAVTLNNFGAAATTESVIMQPGWYLTGTAIVGTAILQQ